LVNVDVPAIPAAANRASIPPLGGGIIGVSGGGGDPLCARVVDVDAVELNLFTPVGFGI
jgi:hypothetical protein